MFLKVPDLYFQKNIVKYIFYKMWKFFLDFFSTKPCIWLLSIFLTIHFSFFFYKFCLCLKDLIRDWGLCLWIRDLHLSQYQNQGSELVFLFETLQDMDKAISVSILYFFFSFIFLILLVSTIYNKFFKKYLHVLNKI